MPSWVAGVAVTFILATVSAYGFLRLRCRPAGRAFGPRAKWWAVAIVVITATVSTGLGVVAVVASHYVRAAYIGLILPGGLLLQESFSQRNRERGKALRGRLAACLTLPFRRHADRMNEDRDEWCEVRAKAVWQKPRGILEAAQYYYNQVARRLKNGKARAELDRLLDSITHKIKIVQMIDSGKDPDQIRDAMQSHPDTQDLHKYATSDWRHLARRLEYDAGGELVLLLAHVYRHGFRKLLIYKYRTPGWP